jgi:HlyD family secretion protein
MLSETGVESGFTKKAKRRRIFVVIIWTAAVAALSGAGYWAWLTWGPKPPDAVDSKNIVAVTRGPIEIKISATGTIRPFNQVKLSPKYTGLLRELKVAQGDVVKKGQVVAVMDDSNLVGQVQAAQSAYLAACANYDKCLHGNRVQEVLDAEAQVDRAENAVKSSHSIVRRSQADVKVITAQLKRDETNANRLIQLSKDGAVSDQDRLNAATQAEMSRAQLERSHDELRQAEAANQQSKSDLASAQQKYSMMKEGFRQEDVRAARQSMLQAEGNFKYLKSQLNDTRIKAPFDGIVTQKYADIGAIVTPTTASTTNSATSSSIISLAGRLELVAAVSETDIENVHVGQEVTVIANAFPDKVFHGKVNLIAPEAIVTQNVTTFEVHAQITDDPQHKLMSGMNVTSEFVSGRKDDQLLVPTAAVVSKHGKTGVFIIGNDGKPKFSPVRVGLASGTKTAVTEGLKEGDKVLLALTKEQLAEQGYEDPSTLGSMRGMGRGLGGRGGGGGGGRSGGGGQSPQLPRGFGR